MAADELELLRRFPTFPENMLEAVWNVAKRRLMQNKGFGGMERNQEAGALAVQWMLSSERPYLRKVGLEIFTCCMASHPELLDEFATTSLAALKEETLERPSEGSSLHAGVEYVQFLLHFLKTFKDGGSVKWRENCEVIKQAVTAFISARAGDMEVLKLVSEMLLTYPECLPEDGDSEKLCSLVVKQIADLPEASSHSSSSEYLSNVRAVMEVRPLLSFLWSQPCMRYLEKRCLEQICQILTADDALMKRPCSCLSLCLDLFAVDNRISLAGAEVLQELLKREHRAATKKLEIALTVLLEWALVLQKSESLSLWVEQIMQALQSDRRQGLQSLMEGCVHWVEKLTRLLHLSAFRRHSVRIIGCFLRLSYTSKEDQPFLKFVQTFRYEVLRKTTSEAVDSASKREMFNEVALLGAEFAKAFPNRTHAYGTLFSDLKEQGFQQSENSVANSGDDGPIPLGWYAQNSTPSQTISAPVVVPRRDLMPKSATGHTGLENLGNTCFVNSILQALFMTDTFREQVLLMPPGENESALRQLRKVFAFLYGTERGFYSPETFVDSCIPPWFEKGHQHDCSEFLQYLFDTMHSEDLEAHKETGQRLVDSGGDRHNSPRQIGFGDEEKMDAPPNGEQIDMDEDEDSDVQMSSTGLSRWKTEENLNGQLVSPDSLDGAQRGLVADTIHATSVVVSPLASSGGDITTGSHDSGIHSVGDEEPAESPGPWNEAGGSGTRSDENGLLGGERGASDEDATMGSKNSLDMDHCVKRKKRSESQDGDHGSGAASSEKYSARTAADNPSYTSLVDRIFGGVLHRFTRCCTCGKSSFVVEAFRDLGLPCDVERPAAALPPVDELEPLPGPLIGPLPPPLPLPSAPPSSPDMVFPPSSPTSFSNIDTENISDGITDVTFDPQPAQIFNFPSPNPVRRKEDVDSPAPLPVLAEQTEPLPSVPASASPDFSSATRWNLADLLNTCLQPERLDGENQYQCNACGGLRDAERIAKIVEPPEHLLLTLKRFSYNKHLQRKSKICRDILCPEQLVLPVTGKSPQDSSETTTSVPYALYAAVIHSGTNSESGHYYSYSRHQTGACGDDWYLLNDRSVGFSDYDSFQDLTRRCSRDTAYVLFYRRMDRLAARGWRELALPADLKGIVDEDNVKYRLELVEELTRKRGDRSEFGEWRGGNDDDGSGGSSGGGGPYRPGAPQFCRESLIHDASPHVC